MANVARIQELLERGRDLPSKAPELPSDPKPEDYARHYGELAHMYANLAVAFHQTLPLIVEEIAAIGERQNVIERDRGRAKKLRRVTSLRSRT